MASYVNRYTDNSDFLLASAVYDNPELTTPSADGFYQKNGIYRQQQGGVLINGSSTCPSCAGNFEVLKVNSISANELCCVSSSSFTAHFNTGDSFSNPSTTLMYTDAALSSLSPDGWYKTKISNQYRQQSSGTLGVLTSCPTCSSGTFYISTKRTVCSDFCTGNYAITSSKNMNSGNGYSSIIINDVVQGTLLSNGWYAYAENYNTQTPSGTFKLMNLLNNVVTSIAQCSAGSCVIQ